MTKTERFHRLMGEDRTRADLRGKSVRAAAFTSAASGADFLLRIGSTAILARLLLPEHFGLVMMVTALTAVAEQLRDFGLSAAIVQRNGLTHEEVSTLFWINLATGVGLALLLGLSAPLIAAYYHEPRLVPLTWLLGSIFIFGGAMAPHQALLTRQLKLGHTSLVRLGASLASTLLAVYLAWAGFEYWSLVWREIARSALIAAGMWLCLPWVPSLPAKKTNVRPLLGFGANLTAANLVGSLSAAADRLLLGRFLGAAPIGLFRQAHQLVTAATDQLVSPIYQVAQPGLSLLQSDPARYRQFFRKMVSMVCLLTMPLSVFVALYATEITSLLLGPKWSAAAPLLAIVSIGTLAKQAVGSTAQVLISLGRTDRLLRLSLLHNVVLVSFMCVGIRWGVEGIARAEVLATYVLIAPRVWYSLAGSPVPIGDFLSATGRPLIACGVMALTLLGFRTLSFDLSPFIVLFAAGAVALVTFHAAWLLLPGGRLELAALAADIAAAVKRKTVGAPPAVS